MTYIAHCRRTTARSPGLQPDMTRAQDYGASVEFLLFIYVTRHPDLACLDSPHSPHFHLSIPTRPPYIPPGLLHFCRPISLVPCVLLWQHEINEFRSLPSFDILENGQIRAIRTATHHKSTYPIVPYVHPSSQRFRRCRSTGYFDLDAPKVDMMLLVVY